MRPDNVLERTHSRASLNVESGEILEVAVLNVKPGQENEFESAFGRAREIIAASPGCLTHQLQRCLEKPNQYILFVRWRNLEDHTIGFRQSTPYLEWKRLLHHFYDPVPTVEHYVVAGIGIMGARAPQELNDHYNEAFRSGRLDDLMSLYETNATLCPRPGIVVQGYAAIRERLSGLMALTGSLETSDQSCVVCEGLALLYATWRFTGNTATGQPVSLSGRSSRVARKQADGTWKYVLDDSQGGTSAT